MHALCSSSSFARRDTKTIQLEREREKSARKRSIKAYHLCSTKENVVSTMTVKRERKNKGVGAEFWDKPYTLNVFNQELKIESSLKIKRHFEYTHRRSIIESYQQNLSLCCFYERLFVFFLSFSSGGDLKTKRWFGKKTLHYFWNNSHNWRLSDCIGLVVNIQR